MESLGDYSHLLYHNIHDHGVRRDSWPELTFLTSRVWKKHLPTLPTWHSPKIGQQDVVNIIVFISFFVFLVFHKASNAAATAAAVVAVVVVVVVVVCVCVCVCVLKYLWLFLFIYL